MALSTLVGRPESEATDLVLSNWGILNEDDHASIRRQSDRIATAVSRCFAEQRLIPSAVAASSALKLYGQVDALATLAEDATGLAITESATAALVELSMPLGQAARENRPVSTTRGPFLNRLIKSVQGYSQHRNDSLVDAFLIVSAWSDAAVRTWVASDDAIGKLIQNRMRVSEHPGIIHLLAGYLGRRRVPDSVAKSLASREEDVVGDAILRSIGNAPSSVTRTHLEKIGIPRSLRGGIKRCSSVTPANRAAMVHVYSAAGGSTEEILPLILFALRRWQQPDVVAAAALALSRCPIPTVQWTMRAAVPVAKLLERAGPAKIGTTKDDPTLESLGSESLADPASVMIAHLMDLLSHPDAGVAKGARRLLTPLHAESMLARFEDLRERSRRSLGRIVMRIDPGAVTRVRDALRHPVLDRRLEAIASADALSIVELLSESFVRIVREDHQEARTRAAQAMGNATDELTYSLLEELVTLPESQVRDAAVSALAVRRRTDGEEQTSAIPATVGKAAIVNTPPIVNTPGAGAGS